MVQEKEHPDFPEEKQSAQEIADLGTEDAFQKYIRVEKPKFTKGKIATFCGAFLGSAWFLLIHLTPVTGSSMAPTALDGSRALALVYMPWEIPQKGQIVQIRIPEAILIKYPNYKYIPVTLLKRVVAVPGDKVGNTVLAKNQYWVQGDNANESADSRVFGPIPRSDFLSHVVYVVPPLSTFWPFKKS
jgi:type IV secretory pathway protease TraF